MRALFWRRKDPRLTDRLNNLVETSERASKNRRRKAPRVVIDTSYLHRNDEPAPDEWQENDTAVTDAPEAVAQDAHDAPGDAVLDVTDEEAWQEYDGVDEESEILREAIAQLDQAEQREAEAVKEAAAAREAAEARLQQIERLQSELSREQRARTAAEKSRDAAIERQRNLEAERDTAPDPAAVADQMAGVAARFEDERRELLDRLDALQKALEEERAEHVDAQAARDAAAGRIATLERELGDLREARQNHIEASARVAELEAGKQALADEIAAIKAELDGQKIKLDEERAAHAEAIAGREAAESHLAEAQCRLSVLDNTQEQMATAEQRLTETLARLEASEASVAQQKAAVCQLGAEVEELRGALADTEKKFEDTVRHAEDTARELADLRHSAAAEDIARQQRSDAEARLAETTSAMEDLRQRVVALETELDAERKSLADLQAEREREQMFGDELQRELTALREQSAERQFAEEAALAESSDLQREEPAQPVVTDTPLHGEAKEEAAPAPIVAGGNAVDEAASRTTKTAEEPPADEPIVAPALAHGGATRPARIAQKTAPATKARDPQPATPVDSLIKSRIGRALEKKEHVKDKRRAKRHSARKVASLWNEGMSATLSCTMLDRSSSGAKLEVLEDRYNDRINEIAIGDRFMLSLSYAQERTTMACEVMWVAGRRCGVRFCGQIHTEVNKPVRRVMPEPELLKKPSATTAIKSLFGAS